MPIGVKANDPKTPYYVYEFSFNNKVFYVGHTYHPVRSGGRWGWVKNVLRLKKSGNIPPAKLRDLKTPSNRVIAALIEAGLPEHVVTKCRPCLGKQQSMVEEKEQILKRLSEGCVLSNVEHNPRIATVAEVLQYLGVAVADKKRS
jgi:hypothetical protein